MRAFSPSQMALFPALLSLLLLALWAPPALGSTPAQVYASMEKALCSRGFCTFAIYLRKTGVNNTIYQLYVKKHGVAMFVPPAASLTSMPHCNADPTQANLMKVHVSTRQDAWKYISASSKNEAPTLLTTVKIKKTSIKTVVATDNLRIVPTVVNPKVFSSGAVWIIQMSAAFHAPGC